MNEHDVTFQSMDGTRLCGTLVHHRDAKTGVILAHGANADRSEDGLFDEFATALAVRGISSLRFDLRGHGASAGIRSEAKPCSVIEDFAAAQSLLSSMDSVERVVFAGASYSGGLAVAAARVFDGDATLLFYPILDYFERYARSAPYWQGSGLTSDGMECLKNGLTLDFFGTLNISRDMLNELRVVSELVFAGSERPAFVAHGSHDKKAPADIARAWASQHENRELLEFHAADHELAVPGDRNLRDPKSISRRSHACVVAADWVRSIESIPAASA